jgi:hypothetical protein
MRNGWPHSADGQENSPSVQGQAPFGPDVTWSNAYPAADYPAADYSAAEYPAAEYPAGDYRYGAPGQAQQSAADQGAHPYAAFDGSGYGDDGYHDPGYQQPGYPQPGYQQAAPYSGPDYSGSGYNSGQGYGEPRPMEIEIAYPAASGDSQHGADLYQQPWDYDQPLRYEGEEESYPARDSFPPASGDYGRGTVYQSPASGSYRIPASDGYGNVAGEGYGNPASYNGSEYSMPGINGPGYDLSGIIGTKDFEAIGYDEPSYDRLSYDDPRYADTSGQLGAGSPFGDETRFDVPRFDETRLDNLWPAGDDARRGSGPAGYGNGGSGDSRSRSDLGAVDAFDRGRGPRSAETRYDLRALVEPGDETRFDVPAFDETRIDNLRTFAPGGGLRTATLLAPPAAEPRGWADDTSLDYFGDLDLTDEPVPAAFTRTLDRPQRDDDTAARRAVGRRRGRSGDRRQWMALGAIAVVAAGAIGGVLMKYVFSGPSGPAHTVVAPQSVDGYARSANLEKQLQVSTEAAKVAKASSGQASNVVSAVYQQGSITPGSDAQIFMFVGGKLAGADPGASVTNFEQTYSGAKAVSAGSLGGDAACTETHLNGQSASMCVWFDNDTFGTVVSPTMTTVKLAATMDSARPSLELLAK